MNNSNYDTYYCNNVYVTASRLANAGGGWDNGSSAGALYLGATRSASATSTYVGARLMFL